MVSEQDVKTLVRDGIDTAKAGDKKLAHTLLSQATRLDPQNEKAWLWRAGVAHNCTEAADCLQQVLSLNPHNQTAIKGLARLGVESAVVEPTPSGGNGSNPMPPELHEAVSVPSQSNAIQPVVSSAGNSTPTFGESQMSDGPMELDVQLVTMDPNLVDQAEKTPAGKGTPEEAFSMPWSDEARLILRVLIVDDSPTIRKLVAMTLGKHGYEVVSAADGMEALARINDGAPDLILLDITMPRMDGYQLCKTIKGNDSTDHIPIVMLTGRDGFMDKVRGRVVGSEGYLTKPFNPDELVRMVKQHVGPA